MKYVPSGELLQETLSVMTDITTTAFTLYRVLMAMKAK